MGHDRHGDDRRNPRKYDRDADMGGSDWSGASGRGGMTARAPWANGPPFTADDFEPERADEPPCTSERSTAPNPKS